MKLGKHFAFIALASIFLFCNATRCPWESNKSPDASIRVTPFEGTINTTFTFDGSFSKDDHTAANELKYFWGISRTTPTYEPIKLGDKSKMMSFQNKFDRSGEYFVSLRVEDSDGSLSDETNAVFTVHASGNSPTASFTVIPDEGTTSTTFNFDASGSSDVETPVEHLEVRWNWDGGTWDTEYSTIKTAEHIFSTIGEKEVELQVKDTDGYESEVATKSVMVRPEGGGGPCPGISQVEYMEYTYNTVQIGDQCWLDENLKVGEYTNSETQQTNNGKIEKYCYNNDILNCNTYGGLYQWNELMQYTEQEGTQGICPGDWHIPTRDDWEELAIHLGGKDIAGGKLKSLTLWKAPNTGATNETGFSALPGGYADVGQNFIEINENACFYSSTSYTAQVISRNFFYDSEAMTNGSGIGLPNEAFSVRCIKNKR